MSKIENIYQSALLADAAYATFDLDRFVPNGYATGIPQEIDAAAYSHYLNDAVDLSGRGWNEAQFEQFQNRYQVVYHQPNALNGFSATLFKDVNNGSYTLAYRGTEGPMDLVQDVALSFGRSILDPLSQENYISNFLENAGVLDASGEVLPEYAGNINVTGHSLGGYLSIWTAYKFPEIVDQTYTFNGAGITRAGLTGPLASVVIENSLSPEQHARIHNLYGEAFFEVVANEFIFYRPGASTGLYIESDLSGGVLNHSMSLLVESLSIYRLFSALDETLSLQSVTDILGAGSIDPDHDLDNAVAMLSSALGGDYNFTTKEGAEGFYSAIVQSQNESQSSFNRIAIKSLINANDDIAHLAGSDFEGLEGNAYRYALNNLVPFVFFEAIENTAAASDAYGYDAERHSESYLQDRSMMLAALSQHKIRGSYYPLQIDGEPGYLFDTASQQSAYVSNPRISGSAPQDSQNILFGDATDNALVGSYMDDRLYGGDGNDILTGANGDDLLEGGYGDDSLNGGPGSDTLSGGQGQDVYIIDKYANWQGEDTITGDLAGDTIHYDGGVLDGRHLKRLSESGNVYQDIFDGTLYSYNEADQQLWINFSSPSGEGTGQRTSTGNLFLVGFDPLLNNAGILLPEYISPMDHPGYAVELGEPNSAARLHSRLQARNNDPEQNYLSSVALRYDAALYYPDPEGSYSPHTYHFEGGDNDDLLVGTDWDSASFILQDSIFHGPNSEAFGDYLNGKDGNDVLLGDPLGSSTSVDEDDVLVGGRGSDTLYGGMGDDYLFAQDEYHLEGAVGAITMLDSLLENSGDIDHLFGGEGEDVLSGGSGGDLLVGGDGADQIYAAAGNDRLHGGDGTDYLLGDSTNKLGFAVEGSPSNEVGPALISLEAAQLGATRSYNPTYSYDDIINGGAGNDLIDGEIGDDEIYGDSGDDYIQGDRFNYAAYFGEAASLYLELDASLHGNDRIHGGSGIDHIDGNGGNDTLHGDQGNDFLRGDDNALQGFAHGEDLLYGGSGHDLMEGNGSDDILFGDAGNDTLWGDRHPEANFGGILNSFGGNQHLGFTFHGSDTLYGGVGNDILDGGGKSDTLYGGADDDTIYGDGESDTLITPLGPITVDLIDASYHGNDLIYGGAGEDTVFAGWGNDDLSGGGGDDVLYGNGGNDLLRGGLGTDTLVGGDGNDTYIFVGYEGTNIIDDNAGNIVIHGASPATINIAPDFDRLGNTSFSYGSTSISIANDAIGSFRFTDGESVLDLLRHASTSRDDIVFYSADGGALDTGAGDDVLTGGDGNDTMNGGLGNDSLVGGAGNDLFQFALASGYDTLNAYDANSDKNDMVEFGEGINATSSLLLKDGDDLVIAFNSFTLSNTENGAVRLQDYFLGDHYQPGSFVFTDGPVWDSQYINNNILILGNEDNDTFYGSSGSDFFSALQGNDTVFGNAGDDRIYGGEGNDYLKGESGADQLFGEAGNDVLVAGEGHDLLVGGPGDDALRGGNGNDIYEYYRGDGNDTILNLDVLNQGDDLLRIMDYDVSEVEFSRQNEDLVLTMDDGDSQVRIYNYLRGDYHNSELDVIEISGQDYSKGDIFSYFYSLADQGDNLLYNDDSPGVLHGLEGNDTLWGLAGSDTLNGGEGSDTLIGGSGSDTYVFSAGDIGYDLIAHDPGQDFATDTILFGPGVAPEDVIATDLGIFLRGSSSRIAIAAALDAQGLELRFEDQPTHSELLPARQASNLLDLSSYHKTFAGDTSLLAASDSLRLNDDRSFMLFGSDGSDHIIDPFSPTISSIALGPGDDIYVGGNGRPTWSAGNAPLQRLIGAYTYSVELGEGNDLAFSGGSDDIIGYIDSSYTYDGYDILHGINAFIHNDSDDTIYAEGGDDIIANYSGDDIIDPGHGNDAVFSGSGDDSYYFGRGYGQDELDASGYSWYLQQSDIQSLTDNGHDRLILGEAITVNDINLWQEGSALVLAIKNSEDRFTAYNYFSRKGTGANPVDIIEFADGQIWDANVIGEKLLFHAPSHLKSSMVTAGSLQGSDQDEILHASDFGNTLYGAAGNDGLYGGSGADILLGESGNDQIVAGQQNDTLVGGDGNDFLIGGDGSDSYWFAENFGDDVIDNYDDTVGRNFIGGEANDRIVFDNKLTLADVSFSRQGDDLRIVSDEGIVTIKNHYLGIGYGFNSRYAIDEIEFRGSGEIAYRTDIDDLLHRPSQAETLIGTGSKDTLFGGAGADSIFGLAGHDTIYGQSGDDILTGGVGNDYLEGNDGNDLFMVNGHSQGFDSLFGGAGVDTLLGGELDDSIGLSDFDASNSVEIINGGSGVNTVVGTGSKTLWDFSATQLNSIALLKPGAGHDTVMGSSANDTIDGGRGNDLLNGGEGDDVFAVNGIDQGFDRFIGGAGADTIVGSTENDIIGLAALNSESGIELLDGGAGINFILGTGSKSLWDFSSTNLANIHGIFSAAGHDTITGSASSDLIVGGRGNDLLDGGEGNDTFWLVGSNQGYDSIIGSNGSDTLLGSAGDDVFGLASFDVYNSIELVAGAAGSNIIQGTASKTVWDFSSTELRDIESIHGGAGHDTIVGSAGDDVLVGGAGNDKLQGGWGSDTYHYSAGDGRDRILATAQGNTDQDTLVLESHGREDIWFSAQGDDLLLDFKGDSGSIQIEDWFVKETRSLATVRAGNEFVLGNELQYLIEAMAAFEPQSFGVSGMGTPLVEPDLGAALAAVWQTTAA